MERVITFGAMGTRMHPAEPSRIFGAATDAANLEDLKKLELTILDEGHISGLNGVVLGVAAERGLPGFSLLGEMPQLFAQLPFPKASLSVLQVFTKIAGIQLDFGELKEQAEQMEHQLEEILAKLEQAMAEQAAQSEDGEEEESYPSPEPEERLSPEDEARVERLFDQARENRSKAYELKGLLDKLDVFKDYEDRFLDLFKKPGSWTRQRQAAQLGGDTVSEGEERRACTCLALRPWLRAPACNSSGPFRAQVE